jgi:glucosamine 6-phosphate synthetase-like amidotransferase/phosphosugar isomerase protein
LYTVSNKLTGSHTGTRERCKEVAAKLVDKQQMFVLGKGYGEPIAYEGALKIKEITYLLHSISTLHTYLSYLCKKS